MSPPPLPVLPRLWVFFHILLRVLFWVMYSVYYTRHVHKRTSKWWIKSSKLSFWITAKRGFNKRKKKKPLETTTYVECISVSPLCSSSFYPTLSFSPPLCCCSVCPFSKVQHLVASSLSFSLPLSQKKIVSVSEYLVSGSAFALRKAFCKKATVVAQRTNLPELELWNKIISVGTRKV